MKDNAVPENFWMDHAPEWMNELMNEWVNKWMKAIILGYNGPGITCALEMKFLVWIIPHVQDWSHNLLTCSPAD